MLIKYYSSSLETYTKKSFSDYTIVSAYLLFLAKGKHEAQLQNWGAKHQNGVFAACHSQGKAINDSDLLCDSQALHCLGGCPAHSLGPCTQCFIQGFLFPGKLAVISKELYCFVKFSKYRHKS